MANDLMQEGPGPGSGPELSDTLLREAFLASEDPELTLFLASLERFSTSDGDSPRKDWREFIAPPESESELGRVDGHVLLELIAEGGMAVVFRAEERALERKVALKMLAPGLAEHSVSRQRFLREAKAAAGLDHENALPIYRVSEEPLPHFTMRHVSGGTLQDRLDRGEALSTAEWFSLARQVGGALGAAHAVGLIHRDIKPANLLYDEQGDRLWVADFGIAASVHDPEVNGDSVLGTPRYMSPEQVRGEAMDGRSDLFTLGAVLYRCVTGHDLVGGEKSSEVFASLLSTDFAKLVSEDETIPLPQRRLLERLLASDPEDRFPDAAAFLARLEEEEKVFHARRPSASRRRGVAIAIFLITSVALLAAAPFILRTPRSAPGATTVVPAPSLPEIRIEGWDGVYRDFASAFAAAPEGATLLLDGVFVCRETTLGPEGRGLSLRPAPGAHAVVIASLPEEHALFFRGRTELHDITFVRESGVGNVLPIVGIHSGDALVRNCRFETLMPESVLLGASLSFTHLENARIERCVFRTRGRDAVGFGFVEGSPPMKLTVEESIFLAGVAMTRREWGEGGSLSVQWDRCVVVAETFFLEHPLNRNDLLSPLAFQMRDSVLDLGGEALRFGNGHSPLVSGTFVEWTGERNRHSRPSLRFDWTASGATFSDSTMIEIPLEPTLSPPMKGSERAPRIAPYVDRSSDPVNLDQLIESIRRDPEFADLVKDLAP
jgi:tRNA A-37 threonylcarbamoyl transferase component Bud32